MTNDYDDASHASAEEMAAAKDPTVGAGTPDTAPWEEPVAAWFRRQPIAAFLLIANAPLAGTLAASIGQGAPWWVSTIAGSAVATVNALALIVRRSVTPTARPRDDHGNALTP